MVKISIKRVYEPDSPSDGRRILVERLWPRGIRKEDLRADSWLKEVAPSTELRKWYGHKVSRWPEFRRRYCEELDENQDAWRPILDAAMPARRVIRGDATLHDRCAAFLSNNKPLHGCGKAA